MSQSTVRQPQTGTITPEQLRAREISAAALLAAAPRAQAKPGIVHVSTAPLSVFGRKVAGHDG